jgi:hypothetical protein
LIDKTLLLDGKSIRQVKDRVKEKNRAKAASEKPSPWGLDVYWVYLPREILSFIKYFSEL